MSALFVWTLFCGAAEAPNIDCKSTYFALLMYVLIFNICAVIYYLWVKLVPKCLTMLY